MVDSATKPKNELVGQVNVVYRAYLDIEFKLDLYNEKYNQLLGRSKHMDLLIAVGAAASGGSGLGILASPEFVWLCGPLTTISTIGGIVKGNYDWASRIKHYNELVKSYAPVRLDYKHLVEDLNASQKWTNEFDARNQELRKLVRDLPVDSTRKLSVKARRRIQSEIKHRLQYQSWWNWQSA